MLLLMTFPFVEFTLVEGFVSGFSGNPPIFILLFPLFSNPERGDPFEFGCRISIVLLIIDKKGVDNRYRETCRKKKWNTLAKTFDVKRRGERYNNRALLSRF